MIKNLKITIYYLTNNSKRNKILKPLLILIVIVNVIVIVIVIRHKS